MSFQVGSACYASVADAGGAACSSFSPVTVVVPGSAAQCLSYGAPVNGVSTCLFWGPSVPSLVKTTTCQSADASGNLVLKMSTTPDNGSGSTFSTALETRSFPACNDVDYVVAAEAIFGSLLVAWAIVYSVNYVRRFLDFSRGDVT